MQNQLETCRTQEEILRNQEREAVEARAALAECRGRREQMERRQAVLQELGNAVKRSGHGESHWKNARKNFRQPRGRTSSQISCIRTRPAAFWRCRRGFWRQSCRKENRARSAARWNTRLPAVWRQSRSGRNRWKRCVPDGMMPIRSRGQPLRHARRRRSLEHESRRRIEIRENCTVKSGQPGSPAGCGCSGEGATADGTGNPAMQAGGNHLY